MNSSKIIKRPVWILSLVSLFTDLSSEMLYPVMPLFLKSIGFSIVLIGILEGVAEATAGLSKGYFGQLSDKKGQRVLFIRWGYSLSAISKPLMAVFTFPFWIFFARTTDRLGKGIRTAARDAFLSDMTEPKFKGRVFGFHRAFDTVGAFLGPLVALILLYYFPGQYVLLFIIAAFPGLVSILLTFFLKEQRKKPIESKTKIHFFSFLRYLSTAPGPYKRLITGLLLFTLFNSSDVFLLLVMKQAGISDYQLILAYVFYNMIYAIFAYPIGLLSDKIGFKMMMIIGLLFFSLVYGGFAFSNDIYWFGVLLFFYGVYAACNESIGKAWITNLVDKSQTATAIGAFTSLNSLITMLSSILAGIIWYVSGSMFTMLFSCVGVVFVSIYFIIFVTNKSMMNHEAEKEKV